jgi:hypothetical protein
LHRIYETLPCPQTDRFISLSLSLPAPVFHHDLNLWSWKQKKKKKRKGKCEEVRCDNKGGERKRESWKDSKVKKKKTNECIDISLSLYIYIYILSSRSAFYFYFFFFDDGRREEKRRGISQNGTGMCFLWLKMIMDESIINYLCFFCVFYYC